MYVNCPTGIMLEGLTYFAPFVLFDFVFCFVLLVLLNQSVRYQGFRE